MTTQQAAARSANNGLSYAAHGLAGLAGVLLVVAAVGWLTGGAPVAAERFGLPLESADARAFAELAGIFKGLLDLFPAPLMIWFALRRQWSAMSATMLVALLFIPGIDLAAALVGGGAIAIHIPYLIALGGGAILYARLAGDNPHPQRREHRSSLVLDCDPGCAQKSVENHSNRRGRAKKIPPR